MKLYGPLDETVKRQTHRVLSGAQRLPRSGVAMSTLARSASRAAGSNEQLWRAAPPAQRAAKSKLKMALQPPKISSPAARLCCPLRGTGHAAREPLRGRLCPPKLVPHFCDLDVGWGARPIDALRLCLFLEARPFLIVKLKRRAKPAA